MFDCIYRDEVKQKIKERMKCLDDIRILFKGNAEVLKQIEKCKQELNQICCDIDDIRTADVKPVIHSRWVWDANAQYGEEGAYRCTNCGYHSDFEENYCSNCGARMDLNSRKE